MALDSMKLDFGTIEVWSVSLVASCVTVEGFSSVTTRARPSSQGFHLWNSLQVYRLEVVRE